MLYLSECIRKSPGDGQGRILSPSPSSYSSYSTSSHTVAFSLESSSSGSAALFSSSSCSSSSATSFAFVSSGVPSARPLPLLHSRRLNDPPPRSPPPRFTPAPLATLLLFAVPPSPGCCDPVNQRKNGQSSCRQLLQADALSKRGLRRNDSPCNVSSALLDCESVRSKADVDTNAGDREYSAEEEGLVHEPHASWTVSVCHKDDSEPTRQRCISENAESTPGLFEVNLSRLPSFKATNETQAAQKHVSSGTSSSAAEYPPCSLPCKENAEAAVTSDRQKSSSQDSDARVCFSEVCCAEENSFMAVFTGQQTFSSAFQEDAPAPQHHPTSGSLVKSPTPSSRFAPEAALSSSISNDRSGGQNRCPGSVQKTKRTVLDGRKLDSDVCTASLTLPVPLSRGTAGLRQQQRHQQEEHVGSRTPREEQQHCHQPGEQELGRKQQGSCPQRDQQLRLVKQGERQQHQRQQQEQRYQQAKHPGTYGGGRRQLRSDEYCLEELSRRRTVCLLHSVQAVPRVGRICSSARRRAKYFPGFCEGCETHQVPLSHIFGRRETREKSPVLVADAGEASLSVQRSADLSRLLLCLTQSAERQLLPLRYHRGFVPHQLCSAHAVVRKAALVATRLAELLTEGEADTDDRLHPLSYAPRPAVACPSCSCRSRRRAISSSPSGPSFTVDEDLAEPHSNRGAGGRSASGTSSSCSGNGWLLHNSMALSRSRGMGASTSRTGGRAARQDFNSNGRREKRRRSSQVKTAGPIGSNVRAQHRRLSGVTTRRRRSGVKKRRYRSSPGQATGRRTGERRCRSSLRESVGKTEKITEVSVNGKSSRHSRRVTTMGRRLLESRSRSRDGKSKHRSSNAIVKLLPRAGRRRSAGSAGERRAFHFLLQQHWGLRPLRRRRAAAKEKEGEKETRRISNRVLQLPSRWRRRTGRGPAAWRLAAGVSSSKTIPYCDYGRISQAPLLLASKKFSAAAPPAPLPSPGGRGEVSGGGRSVLVACCGPSGNLLHRRQGAATLSVYAAKSEVPLKAQRHGCYCRCNVRFTAGRSKASGKTAREFADLLRSRRRTKLLACGQEHRAGRAILATAAAAATGGGCCSCGQIAATAAGVPKTHVGREQPHSREDGQGRPQQQPCGLQRARAVAEGPALQGDEQRLKLLQQQTPRQPVKTGGRHTGTQAPGSLPETQQRSHAMNSRTEEEEKEKEEKNDTAEMADHLLSERRGDAAAEECRAQHSGREGDGAEGEQQSSKDTGETQALQRNQQDRGRKTCDAVLHDRSTGSSGHGNFFFCGCEQQSDGDREGRALSSRTYRSSAVQTQSSRFVEKPAARCSVTFPFCHITTSMSSTFSSPPPPLPPFSLPSSCVQADAPEVCRHPTGPADGVYSTTKAGEQAVQQPTVALQEDIFLRALALCLPYLPLETRIGGVALASKSCMQLVWSVPIVYANFGSAAPGASTSRSHHALAGQQRPKNTRHPQRAPSTSSSSGSSQAACCLLQQSQQQAPGLEPEREFVLHHPQQDQQRQREQQRQQEQQQPRRCAASHQARALLSACACAHDSIASTGAAASRSYFQRDDAFVAAAAAASASLSCASLAASAAVEKGASGTDVALPASCGSAVRSSTPTAAAAAATARPETFVPEMVLTPAATSVAAGAVSAATQAHASSAAAPPPPASGKRAVAAAVAATVAATVEDPVSAAAARTPSVDVGPETAKCCTVAAAAVGRLAHDAACHAQRERTQRERRLCVAAAAAADALQKRSSSLSGAGLQAASTASVPSASFASLWGVAGAPQSSSSVASSFLHSAGSQTPAARLGCYSSVPSAAAVSGAVFALPASTPLPAATFCAASAVVKDSPLVVISSATAASSAVPSPPAAVATSSCVVSSAPAAAVCPSATAFCSAVAAGASGLAPAAADGTAAGGRHSDSPLVCASASSAARAGCYSLGAERGSAAESREKALELHRHSVAAAAASSETASRDQPACGAELLLRRESEPAAAGSVAAAECAAAAPPTRRHAPAAGEEARTAEATAAGTAEAGGATQTSEAAGAAEAEAAEAEAAEAETGAAETEDAGTAEAEELRAAEAEAAGAAEVESGASAAGGGAAAPPAAAEGALRADAVSPPPPSAALAAAVSGIEILSRCRRDRALEDDSTTREEPLLLHQLDEEQILMLPVFARRVAPLLHHVQSLTCAAACVPLISCLGPALRRLQLQQVQPIHHQLLHAWICTASRRCPSLSTLTLQADASCSRPPCVLPPVPSRSASCCFCCSCFWSGRRTAAAAAEAAAPSASSRTAAAASSTQAVTPARCAAAAAEAGVAVEAAGDAAGSEQRVDEAAATEGTGASAAAGGAPRGPGGAAAAGLPSVAHCRRSSTVMIQRSSQTFCSSNSRAAAVAGATAAAAAATKAPPRVLASLRRLTLEGVSTADVLQLVTEYSLPALRRLEISTSPLLSAADLVSFLNGLHGKLFSTAADGCCCSYAAGADAAPCLCVPFTSRLSIQQQRHSSAFFPTTAGPAHDRSSRNDCRPFFTLAMPPPGAAASSRAPAALTQDCAAALSSAPAAEFPRSTSPGRAQSSSVLSTRHTAECSPSAARPDTAAATSNSSSSRAGDARDTSSSATGTHSSSTGPSGVDTCSSSNSSSGSQQHQRRYAAASGRRRTSDGSQWTETLQQQGGERLEQQQEQHCRQAREFTAEEAHAQQREDIIHAPSGGEGAAAATASTATAAGGGGAAAVLVAAVGSSPGGCRALQREYAAAIARTSEWASRFATWATETCTQQGEGRAAASLSCNSSSDRACSSCKTSTSHERSCCCLCGEETKNEKQLRSVARLGAAACALRELKLHYANNLCWKPLLTALSCCCSLRLLDLSCAGAATFGLRTPFFHPTLAFLSLPLYDDVSWLLLLPNVRVLRLTLKCPLQPFHDAKKLLQHLPDVLLGLAARAPRLLLVYVHLTFTPDSRTADPLPSPASFHAAACTPAPAFGDTSAARGSGGGHPCPTPAAAAAAGTRAPSEAPLFRPSRPPLPLPLHLARAAAGDAAGSHSPTAAAALRRFPRRIAGAARAPADACPGRVSLSAPPPLHQKAAAAAVIANSTPPHTRPPHALRRACTVAEVAAHACVADPLAGAEDTSRQATAASPAALRARLSGGIRMPTSSATRSTPAACSRLSADSACDSLSSAARLCNPVSSVTACSSLPRSTACSPLSPSPLPGTDALSRGTGSSMPSSFAWTKASAASVESAPVCVAAAAGTAAAAPRDVSGNAAALAPHASNSVLLPQTTQREKSSSSRASPSAAAAEAGEDAREHLSPHTRCEGRSAAAAESSSPSSWASNEICACRGDAAAAARSSPSVLYQCCADACNSSSGADSRSASACSTSSSACSTSSSACSSSSTACRHYSDLRRRSASICSGASRACSASRAYTTSSLVTSSSSSGPIAGRRFSRRRACGGTSSSCARIPSVSCACSSYACSDSSSTLSSKSSCLRASCSGGTPCGCCDSSTECRSASSTARSISSLRTGRRASRARSSDSLSACTSRPTARSRRLGGARVAQGWYREAGLSGSGSVVNRAAEDWQLLLEGRRLRTQLSSLESTWRAAATAGEASGAAPAADAAAAADADAAAARGDAERTLSRACESVAESEGSATGPHLPRYKLLVCLSSGNTQPLLGCGRLPFRPPRGLAAAGRVSGGDETAVFAERDAGATEKRTALARPGHSAPRCAKEREVRDAREGEEEAEQEETLHAEVYTTAEASCSSKAAHDRIRATLVDEEASSQRGIGREDWALMKKCIAALPAPSTAAAPACCEAVTLLRGWKQHDHAYAVWTIL